MLNWFIIRKRYSVFDRLHDVPHHCPVMESRLLAYSLVRMAGRWLLIALIFFILFLFFEKKRLAKIAGHIALEGFSGANLTPESLIFFLKAVVIDILCIRMEIVILRFFIN